MTGEEIAAAVAALLDAAPPAAVSAREFWTAQFRAGLAYVANPVGLGGLAADPAHQTLVDRLLAAAGAPRNNRADNPIGTGLAAPTIAAHGSTALRERHLLATFVGDQVWCQLFSEPEAGSDLASVRTTAVREGDGWLVRGQKVWTSLAHVAHYGLLLARTDPAASRHHGLTCFIVDMASPGVDVRPLRQLTGDAEFNEVFLDDVRVPDACRLGDVGGGWQVAITTLMNERAALADSAGPLAIGDVDRLLDAWRRRGADPVRRDEVVRMVIRGHALRLTAQRAARQLEAGGPGPEGSILKLGGVRLQQRIEELTLELMGASGVLCEAYTGPRSSRPGEATRTDPARRYLRSRANSIEGGTSEIMCNIVGERVLGLPREPR